MILNSFLLVSAAAMYFINVILKIQDKYFKAFINIYYEI